MLVLSNGELVTVEWVQHEILESPIKVYNFEVQDFHTYFVGESSVLVHNACSYHSKKLRENMEKEGRAVVQGEASAHIVASGGEKRQWMSAKDSRNLLNKYDIDVDTAANGIPLGHPSPHNFTHTRDFNDRVNSRLHNVENRTRNNGYGKKAIRRSLQSELRAIGRQVLGGDYNV